MNTAGTTLADGGYRFVATAADPAGNTSSAARLVVTVDATAPAVASFVRFPPEFARAATVRYRVTFTEPVQPLTPADFTVVAGGRLDGAGVLAVVGSGRVWDVTVSTGTGSGGLTLALAPTDLLTDPTSNPATALSTTGPRYGVDREGPQVVRVRAV